MQLLVHEVKALRNRLGGVTDSNELRALEEDITGKVTNVKSLIIGSSNHAPQRLH